MRNNGGVSVLVSSCSKKRVIWFCCSWLVVPAVIFVFAGFANATAIMDIVWEEYDLNVSAIWGQNTEYPPTGHVIGSANSDSRTGSLIADGSVSIQATSNNAWIHADAEAYLWADTFEVITQVNLDDDVLGGGMGDSGSAVSEWSVLFDLLGDDATLDVGGVMLDASLYRTNRVYLSDLTDMTSNLYTASTSNIGLLAGHRYALTQISGQQYSGLDDTNPTAVMFHNVRALVPEPSTLLITGAGLFGFMLMCGRKRDR